MVLTLFQTVHVQIFELCFAHFLANIHPQDYHAIEIQYASPHCKKKKFFALYTSKTGTCTVVWYTINSVKVVACCC